MLKQHTRLLGSALGLAASAVLVSAGAAGAGARPQPRSGTVLVLRVNRPAPRSAGMRSTRPPTP
jgi:hypothetical protein